MKYIPVSQEIRNHLKRNDVYMDISILTWLMDNKILLQSSDDTFPLNGLQVLPDTKWEDMERLSALMEKIDNV